MNTAVAPQQQNPAPAVVDDLIARGDLSRLTPEQRVVHYNNVCRSLGLNPLTQPFQYVTLNGKLQLYARKDATDQLRKINKISITIPSTKVTDGLLTVHARATDEAGRTDEDFGVVFVGGLKGEAAANALMKATTKAKRRVTLSISGLGFLDEAEMDSIPAQAFTNETAQLREETRQEHAKLHPSQSQDERSAAIDAATETPKQNEIRIDPDAEPFTITLRDDIAAAPAWSTWANTMIGYVRIAQSVDTINDWINANAENLAALSRHDASMYNKLRAMIDHQIAIRGEGDDA